MGLHYGFPKRLAAERGLLKERREKFKDFKKLYDNLFTKEKQNKWEDKVKSKVNKVKKMSPTAIAKTIRRHLGDEASEGVSFQEYRDIIRDDVLEYANEQFTSIFGMPFHELHRIVKEQADSVSELFADRKYAAKMAEMMNRLEYTADPEKLVESYRRSGDDGMYDFTKEKISKINKLLKSDPETYGGQDTVKDTTGLIKNRLISQGYSPEVAQQMAEEQAAEIGAPSAIDKLDKRHPNPFTDFNPRNDTELLYNTTEPGSRLDPVPSRHVPEYFTEGPGSEQDPLEREDVGYEGPQRPSYDNNKSLKEPRERYLDQSLRSRNPTSPTDARQVDRIKRGNLNPFKRN